MGPGICPDPADADSNAAFRSSGRFSGQGVKVPCGLGPLQNQVRCLAVPQSAWDEPSFAELPDAHDVFGAGAPEEGPDEIEINMIPTARMAQLIVYKLCEVGIRNMNDAKLQDKKYGIPERFVPLITLQTTYATNIYADICQIISTPFPFPFCQLCKALLFLYFLCFPFFLDYKLGAWACMGEYCFLTLALLGVDQIGTELENPFGFDSNDLNIGDKVAQLEQEVMFFFKMNGDETAAECFVWMDIPENMQTDCAPPVTHYLANRCQVESKGSSKELVHGGAVSRAHRKHVTHKDDGASDSDDS
ncbi:unnamed protein product [Polarella glacialis]|uniref:Bestrophin homolog n=1 Tax=Polarella glacialis TaxID=89957 RepID=A0A813D2Z9_POLGL|nr:unnamed protein product [Polarella glacialis]